jgi:hypothetical protein
LKNQINLRDKQRLFLYSDVFPKKGDLEEFARQKIPIQKRIKKNKEEKFRSYPRGLDTVSVSFCLIICPFP